MVRPVYLVEVPPFPPYVCIRCGLGNGDNDRLYFIDLGIDLHMHFNPLVDGNIYYCNECFGNLIREGNALTLQWDQEHKEWESPDRVEASFAWQQGIDLSTVTAGLEDGRNSTSPVGEQPGFIASLGFTDPYGGTPSETDAVPEPAVSDAVSDDDGERQSSLSITFDGFRGNS